jgi:hypothetical protein
MFGGAFINFEPPLLQMKIIYLIDQGARMLRESVRGRRAPQALQT